MLTSPANMTDAATRVDLSLISHTNAGKTTLARTLLGRDVGEVRDAPHVTGQAEPYTLVETPEGDVLRLWDTPGFGDSARLAKRLQQHGNPIGWFLSEVWDRWRDRPFWSSQQAIRNVREQADVVLYLINASEAPADAGYVAPELQILEWIGKPAIVLLNQMGQPRERFDEETDEARWQRVLGQHAFIQKVLPLDAFARCWVQELTLLRAVGVAIPDAKRSAFARLTAAWQTRREEQFAAAMNALAAQIAHAACDREALTATGLRATLRDVGKAIGLTRGGEESAKERAMRALADRLVIDIRASTDQLISVHNLEGRAAGEVLARMATSFTSDEPVNEGTAAVFGGFVTGAVSGLAADLAAGGITFGAGLLTGGVLGALGAAGLARGFNLMRGSKETSVRWSEEFLDGLVLAALLRYLAVAHYGRGRGEWSASEHPPFWKNAVAAVLESRRAPLAAIWAQRGEKCSAANLTAALQDFLASVTTELLENLYPQALPRAVLATARPG
ncbi:MAG: DUF3482 domain-containing protein [Casimicrobiaceae bacterium]